MLSSLQHDEITAVSVLSVIPTPASPKADSSTAKFDLFAAKRHGLELLDLPIHLLNPSSIQDQTSQPYFSNWAQPMLNHRSCNTQRRHQCTGTLSHVPGRIRLIETMPQKFDHSGREMNECISISSCDGLLLVRSIVYMMSLWTGGDDGGFRAVHFSLQRSDLWLLLTVNGGRFGFEGAWFVLCPSMFCKE